MQVWKRPVVNQETLRGQTKSGYLTPSELCVNSHKLATVERSFEADDSEGRSAVGRLLPPECGSGYCGSTLPAGRRRGVCRMFVAPCWLRAPKNWGGSSGWKKKRVRNECWAQAATLSKLSVCTSCSAGAGLRSAKEAELSAVLKFGIKREWQG